MEEFSKNKKVLKYVNNLVDEYFDDFKDCKWLKYKIFKKERAYDFIETIFDHFIYHYEFDDFDYNDYKHSEHLEDVEFYPQNLLIGFSTNYVEFEEMGFDGTKEEIPSKIILIFVNCFAREISSIFKLPEDIARKILSFWYPT